MNHWPEAASKLPSPLHDLILEVKELIRETDDCGPFPLALLSCLGGEPTPCPLDALNQPGTHLVECGG